MRSLSLALLFPFPALAATITVPDDFATLEEAVAMANGGDIVRLAEGTYDVEVTIDKNLTIQALTDAEVTLTNTTGNSGSILDVTSAAASVILRDLRFEASGTNRAVRSSALVLTMEDIIATGLETTGDGAFLEANDAIVVSLNRIEVTGALAANGGVVAMRTAAGSAGTLTISNSTFETGEVTGDGGLIYVENSSVTIQDSVLTDGTATNGAGVYAASTTANANFVVRRSEVDGNVASELGGGVYAQGYEVDFDNVTVSGNFAAAGGGAWLDQDTATERLVLDNDSLFTGNTATGGGSTADGAAGIGAALRASQDRFIIGDAVFEQSSGTSSTVWLSGNELTFTDVDFQGNTATEDAAALHADITTTATITGGLVDGNDAGTDAGGFWLQAAEVSLTDDPVFTQNTAAGDGGALWVSEGYVDVQDALFADNAAARGGAVFRSGTGADLDLSDTDFFRNQADDGGAVWAAEVVVLRSRRNFWCENSAGVPGIGGAVLASGNTGSTVLVRNDAASDNLGVTGGVYALDGFDSVDVGFSTFVNNGATTGGVASIANVSGATTVDHVAALDSSGSAFEGSGAGALTVSWSALLDNLPGDFAGGFAGTTPTDGVTLTASPVVNNHPGTQCEDTRLYPAVGSDLLDVGPGNDDFDGSATDVGMSGGSLASISLFLDGDGDGFVALEDCDDANPDSNPDAPDVCNGFDDDCDGETDENPGTDWFADTDGDTYGDPAAPYTEIQCDPPATDAVSNALDCNDADPSINPDAEEVCDTVDNDCDGTPDNDATDAVLYYEDLDFDGYGTEDGSILACTAPPGFTDVTGDCDDSFANVYPGATENCDTLDNDCNGTVDDGAVDAPAWYPDADHDGFGVDGLEVVQCLAPLDHSPFGGDCDDTDEFRNPGASELCDGIDNDCDGTTDQDPSEPVYFPDNDGDGYGDANATPVGSCTPVSGLLEDGSDCDDTDALINPDADENCDGIDQNCDGDIDDDPVDGNVYYLDSDQDGFGSSDFEILACVQPNFASTEGGDCNDTNDVQFPGNTEVCDNWDNDCDGETDEDDAADAVTWYADEDDDAYGDDNVTQVSCSPPIGYVPAGGDCQDTNPTAHPGRQEICDGVDNDCDGEIDGQNAENVQFYFADADGDGFGDPLSELGACTQPDGYTTNSQDCDDSDANANPSAPEVPGNGIDEDCNGSDLPAGGDTDTGEPGEGCQCSSSSPSPIMALLPLVALMAVRRRRA